LEDSKKNWPKISIVTPSFNQAEFLERTINSVLSQNYPNLEYIIIDGGSTDGSVEIIKKYADKLAYWVSEKDKGQSHALNKGFRMATGDITAWLNSDDEYCPDALETVAKVFISDETSDFVFGNRITIDKNNKILRQDRHTRFSLRAHVLLLCILSQPASFWRRSLFENYGYIDESLRFAMDYEFYCRIGAHIKAKHIRKNLAMFRIHDTSKTCTIMDVAFKECYSIQERYKKKVCGTFPTKLVKMAVLVHRAFLYAVQGDGLYVVRGGVRRLLPRQMRPRWL
jgi:glycosyltransferase involved in cell wall biosynthesis